MSTTNRLEAINKVVNSEHHDPFEVLGYHNFEEKGKKYSVIRVFNPLAKQIFILNDLFPETEYEMKRITNNGVFELTFEKEKIKLPYRLKVLDYLDKTSITYDTYAFLPILSDYDMYLYSEGKHERIYDKLGAHMITIDDIDGVFFSVWAPNAMRVSIIGDFNNWDGRCHQMRVRSSSGIWELFIPEIDEFTLYKYEIKTQYRSVLTKSDPFAFYSELRPRTASIVYDMERFEWNDDQWLNRREYYNGYEAPMAIYEVHLGSWMRFVEDDNRYLNYRELAVELVDYVKRLGYTHIEIMPVAEHPFDGSWGYQVTGYYSVTSRYGEPDDFKYFVDYCHRHNIGVILDWVPGHFPTDGHGLINFDGTCLYEHADPRQGKHMDWDTLIFNYGRNEVKNFLMSNALFWFDKYHIDGLRVDGVASMLYLDYSRKEGEWVPNQYGGRENIEAIEFLKLVNERIYSLYPGAMTIAEESTAWSGVSKPTYVGGLGFGFKWNMGWMNDILSYIKIDPIFRHYHQNMITFALLYAFHENFVLVLSHDEVVHGKGSILSKMPGDVWQKFANVRLLYAFMYGHPGKKLLFMGAEIGQWKEWDHDNSLDWHLLDFSSHSKLQKYLIDLNHLYKHEPALYEKDFDPQGFEWIDFSDIDNCIISFIRIANDPKDFLVFVCNFTPVPRHNYKVGVPQHAFYKEVLNSDSAEYWGSNIGNHGGLWSDELHWQNRPFSLNLTIPPLSCVILKPVYEQ